MFDGMHTTKHAAAMFFVAWIVIGVCAFTLIVELWFCSSAALVHTIVTAFKSLDVIACSVLLWS